MENIVDYDDLRSRPLEDLVNNVQQLTAVASRPQVQSVAALAARCVIELSDSLGQTSGAIFQTKKTLAIHLPALTEGLKTASAEASRQTAALVRWTKVLVFVTLAYVLMTGGLLLVAILR